MTSSRSGKRPSAGGSVPPTGRGSARRGRPPYRGTDRSLARAGSRGSGGNGLSPVAGWSLAFVFVAIVIVVAAVVVSQSKGSVGALVSPGVITPPTVASAGRTLGKSDAPVTIDLYGDFRCSACHTFTAGGTEQSLVDNYIATGKARLVWHDYLTIDKIRGETTSRDAANAAWCAADQGKFWVMHDWLYANQSPTEEASAFTAARLSDIGKAAGLDMSKFQPCLDQGTHDGDIAAEDAGTPKAVTGTPTVYVNGNYVHGATANSWPVYDQIKAAIDVALAAPSPSPAPTPSPAPSVSVSASPS